MSPLTPLRFIRTDFAVGDVRYGQSQYLTACERFYIHKRYTGEWIVEANLYGNSNGDNEVEGFSWAMWLIDMALDEASFTTRTDLIEVLEAMLIGDDIIERSTAPLHGLDNIVSL